MQSEKHVSEWIRVGRERPVLGYVIASRVTWMYEGTVRNEDKYNALGKRDGDIIINGNMGPDDILDLDVMLCWGSRSGTKST